ncbi:MAG TPA: sigma-70 family RNA polymerase sigma factor [Aggregatilinea sp.]|uniref:RNA polymerase sigma factor n=1 Tax=Aggregatilinea sp. TaxID=2806333 RepID=UPI002CF3AF26|nr:sigma-70 family RNA polymerase sigma factor [Aggregatilinea sp.]HML20759.1 sigma-70 family RNA polymerase sigma factor [Aggregatilinea sp.]
MPDMTQGPIDEQQILEDLRHNSDAFRVLYQRYFPRVFAYTAYRIGRNQDTEDVVAETFALVVEKIGQFEWRGDGSFAAWLFRIAHSRVQQFYRQRHVRHEPVPLDDLPDIESHLPSPDQVFADKERFWELRQAIEMLSPRKQEIVTLRFFGELRNREIAAVLGLDERTVASHLSRAVEDLQRMYQPEPEGEGQR